MWRTILLPLSLAVPALLWVACGDEGDDAAGGSAGRGSAADTVASAASSYRRTFVFSGPEVDDDLLLPLLFHSEVAGDRVERSIQGWISRGGTWEAFASEEWIGSRPAAAWRILPRGELRLVVGQDDAIESIVYGRPPRSVELDLGATVAEWSGPSGSTVRLEETTLHLGDEDRRGVTLDLARVWRGGRRAGGDWAFLASGDSLQVILEGASDGRRLDDRRAEGEGVASDERASDAERPDGTGMFTGYARLDSRTLRWPEVTVEWTETRTYEAARRDVPAGWRVGTDDGELAGAFESVSAELGAGPAEGPVLPVEAFFEVRGTLSVEGRAFPVHGLVRYESGG